MSEPRLKYGQLAPEGFAKMRELEHYLNTGDGLRALVAGAGAAAGFQLNGCEFCVRFHTAELKKANETEERIAGVAEWREFGPVYAAGARGAGVGRGGDEYSGWACSGYGV